MKVKQAIAEITSQRKEKISYEKMGIALSVTRQRIGQMINDDLSEKQVKELENYFDVNLTGVKLPENDLIKIPYWEGIPEELKHSEYTYVIAQRASIEQGWNLKPESLCITVMNGDAMEYYWYKIRNNDVLIIDTSENKINANGSGVYFATSRNNTMFWIREMQMLYNGDIEFRSYSPSGNRLRTYTQKQLNEVDFKVIGKVIKNVSFTL